MPRALTIAGTLVAFGLVVLWGTGGLAVFETWVVAGQKDVQAALAGAVRRLRGGQPGALFGFLTVCFAYGVMHAAGPGHGKLVIGSYGVARRVPLTRLAVIAVASSLAQAGVAVALVAAGFWALGWGRDQTEATATRVIAPLGTLAIAGIGVWLIWRGGRGLWRRSGAAEVGHSHGHGHDHDRDHDRHHGQDHPQGEAAALDHIHGPNCGHAHGPSLDQVAALTSARDALALIAGIALRPCTGALLVLILCFQLGLAGPGIAGAFAMGSGTALVTLGVAGLAVWGREGALVSLSEGRLASALPLFEIVAGAVIVLTAFGLLAQSL